MFNLILFGPPGSGKGTQSVKIAKKYNLAHISTGEIFRQEIRDETELGLKVKDLIEKGNLVPDELLMAIIEKAMKGKDGQNGFIFDGFPRTIQQADDLSDLMAKYNDRITLVLGLDVKERELVKRLLLRAEKEGRKDDTEEVIRQRMIVYKKQTRPLLEYYKAKKKFRQIHGIGTVDEIFDNLCNVLDTYL